MGATYVKNHEAKLRECLNYPHHRRELLEKSGINSEVLPARGYRTIKSKDELGRLGFSPSQRLVPALLIPMYSPRGESVTQQIRPDSPRNSPRKKEVRAWVLRSIAE